MPHRLTDAWRQLNTASVLALGWAAENGDNGEAWEIRIAAAEVVDLFQQVAMRRADDFTAEAFAPTSPVPAPREGHRQAAPGSAAETVTLLPGALKQALDRAVHQLEALAPHEPEQSQLIPVDASQWRYDLYGGEDAATKEDNARRDDAADRSLAQQARDVQAGLLALNQRLALQNERTGWLSSDPPTDAPPAAASGPAPDPTQRYRDQADKLRARMDTFGKALGALGTTLVSAAGISRIDGLYPIPPGDTGFIWGTFASLVVGLVAVLWIALRLNKVANPISLRADIDDLVAMNEIGPREARLVREVYRRTYELNNAGSLLAYELRGIRLERIRGWIGDTTAAQACADRAADVRTDIDITLARASTTLVRRRATRALSAGLAPGLYAAFVAAIVGFAICSGKLTSDQTGRVAIVKSCGDALTSLNGAATATTTAVSTQTATTVSTVTDGTAARVTTATVPETTTVVSLGRRPGLAGVPKICKP